MVKKYVHLSQEELVRFADGELPSAQAADANDHLAACWECRSRLHEMEQAISDFVRIHHETFDPQLTSIEGPRRLLAARLRQLAASNRQARHSPLHQLLSWRTAAYAAAVLLMAALGTAALYRSWSSNPRQAITRGVPDRRLTPGVARAVSFNDVCSKTYSDDAQLLPAFVQQKVLQEYGIQGAVSREYRLDYLISPQLGGTDDIRNLWPEPQSSTQWNMAAKDALEHRLHQLVCQGRVDVSTAQRDLASDWVSAYKRYFHTEQPVKPI